MRTETVYIAEDGTVFWTATKCLAHEALCADVAVAVAPLGPPRNICGPRWYQHHPENVRAAQRAFLTLAIERGNTHPWFTQTLTATETGPVSGRWFGNLTRVLDGPQWDQALGRLGRIGEDGREWEQPYYVEHPEDGEGPISE